MLNVTLCSLRSQLWFALINHSLVHLFFQLECQHAEQPLGYYRALRYFPDAGYARRTLAPSLHDPGGVMNSERSSRLGPSVRKATLSDREVTFYRTQCVVAAVSIPLFLMLNTLLVDRDAFFLVPEALALSAAYLLVLSLSHRSIAGKEHLLSYVYLVNYLLSLWILRVVMLYQFGMNYAVAFLVAVLAISVTYFRSAPQAIAYFLTMVVAASLALWLTPHPDIDSVLYIAYLLAVCLVGYTTIQVRGQIQRDLTTSEERYRGLVENASDAIATLTLDGVVTSVNRALEEMLGWSQAELIGRHYVHFLTPYATALVEERTNRSRAGERLPAMYELELLHRNGSIVVGEARGRVLRDKEGRPTEMQIMFRDITSRKQAEGELQQAKEAAEVANRHKSEFLAGMSHELRTPLNSIIGFSEVLLEKMFGDLNEKQEEYLHDILSSGRHLLSLINDILDLAKVEAGKLELEPTVFNLRELLEGSVVMVRERAHTHGVSLAIDIAPEIGVMIGDERKVKQIMFNLLSNAIKFTSDRGQVGMRATRTDGQVQVAVWDTGVGIAPTDQVRIFEAFQQVGGAGLAGKVEGTGLGLALTKKFVELHGGQIWVESMPGRGSTFVFTLPAEITQIEGSDKGNPPIGITQSDSNESQAATGALVLVIENDPKAAHLLRLYVTEAGYRAVIAKDGAEGVERAQQLHPAAILLDVLLPKVDGWSVLTQLKANPETHAIPILIVSIVDEKPKGLALGAMGYLIKPIQKEALLAKLQAAVPVHTSSSAQTDTESDIRYGRRTNFGDRR